jgi:hypothetical protein
VKNEKNNNNSIDNIRINRMKYILSFIMVLGLIGCGINCSGKPPKRAYIHQVGGYSMQYHYSIYIPSAKSGHSPSVKCSEYEYSKIDIYTDDLENVRGDAVIWKSLYGDLAFEDYGENPANITLDFSTEKVIISGWSSINDGTYKVETSSPDSWGIPIF